MFMNPLFCFMLKFIKIFPDEITAESVSEWNKKDLSLPPEEKRPQVDFVENLSVPGTEARVPVRIYAVKTEKPAPAIIYYHGGGFALGGIELFDIPCRKMCRLTKATVISVDYRLAPRHPFPAAVVDAYAVLEWVSENARRLNIDPGNINTCGDSAGGTLALVVPIMARDRKGPKIAHQIGIYPCTSVPPKNPADSPYRSFQEGTRTPVLTSHDVYQFLSLYGPNEEDWVKPYIVPMNADDLSGLPPAYIITAGHCPLKDEGEAYAKRLEAAGVDVKTECYRSMAHAFFSFPLPAAAGLMKKIGKFING